MQLQLGLVLKSKIRSANGIPGRTPWENPHRKKGSRRLDKQKSVKSLTEEAKALGEKNEHKNEWDFWYFMRHFIVCRSLPSNCVPILLDNSQHRTSCSRTSGFLIIVQCGSAKGPFNARSSPCFQLGRSLFLLAFCYLFNSRSTHRLTIGISSLTINSYSGLVWS